MNKELINKKKFTRRAFILGSCKLALTAGLISRMFYLQVIAKDKFSALSDKNRIRNQVIVPLRGNILDRNKIQLAKNIKSFELIFSRTDHVKKKDAHQIISKIKNLIDLEINEKDEAKLINDIINLKIDEYIVLKESLSWQELARLEVNLFDLPGASIELGHERQYPFGEVCSHITGYIGNLSSAEKSALNENFYPNYKVGKNGIEKTQENILHGKAGYNKLEVNATGDFVKEISSSPAISGADVELSIDIELQKYMFDLLDETGAAILVKLDNGEIIASVSKPGFDSNMFTRGISAGNWQKLINNPELPLLDRAVALNYPPGSVFKINVAIAALKNNFSPDTKFNCPGYYMVGDRAFKCWNKAGHGNIDLYQAIAGSCNVYFWNVAKIIGIDPIAEMARKLGYGQKLLNNQLPREQAGLIPDPDWKLKTLSTKWNFADTINSTIGQGYVEATPLQILTMTARIASGLEIKPTILKCGEAPNFASLDLDRELSIVKKGMSMCTHDPRGTAYSHRILDENIAMAGKTGTCQVISKRHKDDDLSLATVEKRHRNHGVFVAYAPLKEPKYAFASIIEHGGNPKKAIKLANQILTQAQKRGV